MNLARLSYLSVARFSGPDAAAFLQAQLSADVGALPAGGATFACYCSPRGQVMGLLLVCRRDQDFLTVAADALLPGLLERLRLFVLRARVESALEPGLSVHGVLDPSDGSALRDAWCAEPTGLCYVLRAENAGAATGEEAAHQWKQRELQAGVTWLSPATSERFIPQMLGFEHIGAVSFSKGCYPGQEIVARARYLGRVKRRPLLVRAQAPISPEPGSSVSILRGEEWVEMTVLDSASGDQESTWVLGVGPETSGEAVRALRFEGDDYLCATM